MTWTACGTARWAVLIAGVRAPSTLRSFLRSFTHGHVKQLHAVGRRFLPALARHTPLLPGADQVAYVDIRLGTGTVPPDRARCSTPGATTPRSPTPRSPCTIPSVITDGPPGRPARPAASPCTYPNARPGARTSPSSSASHMRYQAPDAPRPTCPKGPDTCGRVEELGRPAATPHPNPRLNPDTAHTTPKRPPRNQPVDPGSVHLHPDTSRKQTWRHPTSDAR